MGGGGAADAGALALADENAQLRRVLGEMRREMEALHAHPGEGPGAPPGAMPHGATTARGEVEGGEAEGEILVAVRAERDQLLDQRNKLMALSNELKRDLKVGGGGSQGRRRPPGPPSPPHPLPPAPPPARPPFATPPHPPSPPHPTLSKPHAILLHLSNPPPPAPRPHPLLHHPTQPHPLLHYPLTPASAFVVRGLNRVRTVLIAGHCRGGRGVRRAVRAAGERGGGGVVAGCGGEQVPEKTAS